LLKMLFLVAGRVILIPSNYSSENSRLLQLRLLPQVLQWLPPTPHWFILAKCYQSTPTTLTTSTQSSSRRPSTCNIVRTILTIVRLYCVIQQRVKTPLYRLVASSKPQLITTSLTTGTLPSPQTHPQAAKPHTRSRKPRQYALKRIHGRARRRPQQSRARCPDAVKRWRSKLRSSKRK
jgi:hypothetical protein